MLGKPLFKVGGKADILITIAQALKDVDEVHVRSCSTGHTLNLTNHLTSLSGHPPKH